MLVVVGFLPFSSISLTRHPVFCFFFKNERNADVNPQTFTAKMRHGTAVSRREEARGDAVCLKVRKKIFVQLMRNIQNYPF